MSATENMSSLAACHRAFDKLVSPSGEEYRTTPANKVKLPVVEHCIGLNVIQADRPDIKRGHSVMLSVARTSGTLAAKLWATAELDTGQYLRPGVIHRIPGSRYLCPVEPNIYDGYQLTATPSGLVTVDGLRRIGTEFIPESLTQFNEGYEASATAFLAAVNIVLESRSSRVMAPQSAPRSA